MKIFSIILWLIILQHLAFCQDKTAKISIQPIATENEQLPFFLEKIRVANDVSKTIGTVENAGDELIYHILLDDNFGESINEYIQKRFNAQDKKDKIVLEITKLKIHHAAEGKYSPHDTLLFECRFLRKEKDHKEITIYSFNARNSLGTIKNPNAIFEKYIVRFVVSAIHQFEKAYIRNAAWNDDLKQNFAIKTTVLHNKIKQGDSIKCEPSNKLTLEDYKGKLPKDSLSTEVISRLILTYLVETEETSKGITMMIYTKAFFDKNRSWKKMILSDEAWLVHQQIHFDICTVYGYKLKDSLAKYEFSIGEYKSELNKIYNAIYSEYTSIRKDFDVESNKGVNKEIVSAWRQKVNDWMKDIN